MKKGFYTSTALSAVLTTAAMLNGGCAQMPPHSNRSEQPLITHELQKKPPSKDEYQKFFASPDLTNQDLLNLSALALYRIRQNEVVPWFFVRELSVEIERRKDDLPSMVGKVIIDNYYPHKFNDRLRLISGESPLCNEKEVFETYWQSALLVMAENPLSLLLSPPQFYSFGSKYVTTQDRVKYGLAAYDATPDSELFEKYLSAMSTDILTPEQSTLFIHLAAKWTSIDPTIPTIDKPNAEDAKKFAIENETIIGVATIEPELKVRMITYIAPDGSTQTEDFINDKKVIIDALSSEQIGKLVKIDPNQSLPITDYEAGLIGLDKSKIVNIRGYDHSKHVMGVIYERADGKYCLRVFENGELSKIEPAIGEKSEAEKIFGDQARIARANTAMGLLLPQILRSADWSRIDPKFMMGTKIIIEKQTNYAALKAQQNAQSR